MSAALCLSILTISSRLQGQWSASRLILFAPSEERDADRKGGGRATNFFC